MAYDASRYCFHCSRILQSQHSPLSSRSTGSGLFQADDLVPEWEMLSRLEFSSFALPQLCAQYLRRTASASTPPNRGPLLHVRGMAGRAKGKKGKDMGDLRVRLIRYSLYHPLTPRPLRFGTMRMLRHWAIHRAWQIYKRNVRKERELELERQYYKIRDACEELMNTDLRLFRIAVSRKGVGFPPIELRIPTDTPPKNGWNHNWTRAV